MASTIAPEQILKELSQLWTDSAKQGDAGILRACSMTLLVLAEAGEDTQALGDTIAQLMPEHPARTIVVKLSGAGERALTERVYSQCWMPFGQRRHICCEQVELTVSDAAAGDLQSVILPLMASDLPLIVWCRTSRILQMQAMAPLLGMAHKLVLDTAHASDPWGTLKNASTLAGHGVILGDLSWTGLTRWRGMLAQVFENQQNVAMLAQVGSIEVEWGGVREMSAHYMGAWVRDSLVTMGSNPAVRIHRAADEDLLRVRLSGPGLTVELERNETRMVVTLNGASQCTNLPRPTDYILMREELAIVRHDPVFEKTLVSALRLAYPTNK